MSGLLLWTVRTVIMYLSQYSVPLWFCDGLWRMLIIQHWWSVRQSIFDSQLLMESGGQLYREDRCNSFELWPAPRPRYMLDDF
jgi:hypothetical protein